jgi:Secretion system C-terminal sorting domain
VAKKILSFLSCFFLLLSYSFAQVCTPDPQYNNPNTQRGVHPDTVTNFAEANVGIPYSQTITILVPADTVLPFGKLMWDSAVLVSVSGLPSGFTYACGNSLSNPGRCSWKGNSIGCVVITGTALTTDIGTHPLIFNTINYLGGSAFANPYPVKGYRINVVAIAGIHEDYPTSLLQQNNPNPFDDITEIQFSARENGTAHLKICNVLGTTVQEFDLAVKKGINKTTVNAKDFSNGIYFYSLKQGSDLVTRKMVVEK